MKKTKISDKGEKITNKDIENFEKENNIVFPIDYRKFLLKYNGGYPNPNCYLCDDNFGRNVLYKDKKEDELEITVFTGLDGSFLAQDILPQNIITIGEDVAGNYFCISVSGEDVGKIYFCNHDDSDEGDYSNLYLVANTFDDFFNNLQKTTTISQYEKYCENNDLKSIKNLIDNGLDINTKIVPNHQGYSLLNIAISERKPDIIKFLLEKGASTNASIWKIYPDQEIMDLLLKNGANINDRNIDDETPLFRFVAMSCEDIVEFLIKNGADVFAKNNEGKTALDLRLKDTNKDDEIVKILKKAMSIKK